MKEFNVNILGTKYKVTFKNKKDDALLEKWSGYIHNTTKTIIIDEELKQTEYERTLSHEIVHGFLFESGLDTETWATNEEIVDWIAIQCDKLFKTMLDGHNELSKQISE